MTAMLSMMPTRMRAVRRLLTPRAGLDIRGTIGGGPLAMAVSTRHREAGTDSPQRGHANRSTVGGADSGGSSALQKGQRGVLVESVILSSIAVGSDRHPVS